jgi:hypothetical protein
VNNPAPLEYRAALDAMAPILSAGNMLVINNISELDHELENRSIAGGNTTLAPSALWIEPMAESWRDDLLHLQSRLAPHGRLFILVSLPLARFLPERTSWSGSPLGCSFIGVRQLHRAVTNSAFSVSRMWGFHGLESILLNSIGTVCHRLGRADLTDRLSFAARLRYCRAGTTAMLSTVALIETARVSSRIEGGASDAA